MVTDTLEATAYQAIEVRRVRPDPEQPRKTFNDEALQELARSLKSNGLLQPITVRPDEDDFILIAGERRWRAACLLGWKTIPAIVRSDVTPGEAAKLQLLENIVRRDLNPVEEASAFKKMLEEGYTLRELSRAVGIPGGHIAWRVQMLDAREDVLALVAAGQVRPLVAHALSRLTHAGQGRALRAINSQCLTYQEVRALCERINAEENQFEMFPETKLSEAQVRAMRTFTAGFSQICSVLNRIERMNEDNPDGLAKAFLAEGGTMEAQINASIRGLNRVKSILGRARMQRLAVAINRL